MKKKPSRNYSQSFKKVWKKYENRNIRQIMPRTLRFQGSKHKIWLIITKDGNKIQEKRKPNPKNPITDPVTKALISKGL